jgi:hypothetical protein
MKTKTIVFVHAMYMTAVFFVRQNKMALFHYFKRSVLR